MTSSGGHKSWQLAALIKAEKLSVFMATLSGLAIILLALFITADVLGRGMGAFYSGATDEISGFVMAMAATWALAYTLTIDKHIRVDIIFGFISKGVRRALDLFALLLLGAFATLLMINSWRMALDSFEINALSPSVLQVPLGIPQALMAFGFTTLAAQSFIALWVAAFEPLAFEQTRAAESSAAPEQFDV